MKDRPSESAEDHFRKAQALAPNNLAAATRLAASLELGGRYLDALAVYGEHSRRWRRIYETRYRVAAILAMSDAWLSSISSVTMRDEAALSALLTRVEPAEAPPARASEVHAWLLARAIEIWDELDRFVSWRASIWRYAVAIIRRRPELQDAPYQRRFLRHRTRRRAHDTIALVKLSTEVQLVSPWPAEFADSKSRLKAARERANSILRRDGGRTPEINYAGGCCYARLYEQTGGVVDAESALEALQTVMQAGDAQRWIAAIAKDPDLAALRRTPLFRSWWRQLNQAGPAESRYSWAIEFADLLVERWRIDAVLSEREARSPEVVDVVARSRAVQHDDELAVTFASWLRTEGASGDADELAQRLVHGAAAFHVRVALPPMGLAATVGISPDPKVGESEVPLARWSRLAKFLNDNPPSPTTA